MKRAVIAAITMCCILASCREKQADEAVVSAIEQSKEPEPTPLKVYTKDGMSVKAYDFDGLEHFLKKNNDTTYVVNFWATWCVPCVEELPHFEKLNTNYKNDKVKVLLVSLDMHKMIDSKLLPFMKEQQLKSRVVVLRDPDQNTWLPKVDASWSGALPATMIFKGNSRKFFERSFTFSELEKEVNNIKQQ